MHEMNDLHREASHATEPLSAEERKGLIPAHITLRSELNAAEQENILEAAAWVYERKRPLVSEAFCRTLHKRMYGKVWKWAGTYRQTGKNIGVDANQIRLRLYETLDQFKYWIEHRTFPPDELAVRFHHALVFIHPFPNGNGRWSRLMADVLGAQLKIAPFTWGSGDLREDNEVRRTYIRALQTADGHDFGPLTIFARS